MAAQSALPGRELEPLTRRMRAERDSLETRRCRVIHSTVRDELRHCSQRTRAKGCAAAFGPIEDGYRERTHEVWTYALR